MTEIIVAIIGVTGVVVGAVITGYYQKRKTFAEAENDLAEANEKIRQTVMALIQPLKVRIDELECEVKILKDENADLKTWAEALVSQIKQLGKEPIPFRTKRE